MIKVENYIKLAYKVASNFYREHLDMSIDEINSVALLGLVKAANRFNEEKGVNFAVFARVTIEYEIKESIFRDKNKFIIKKIDGKEKYERIYIDSLNIKIKSAEEIELVECIAGEFDIDKEIDNIELKMAINKLDEDKREVINMLYFEGKTQKEIGMLEGVSQITISRRKQKAISLLKEILIA